MSDRNACTIVIDTNQFFTDWLLDSARWSNLLEYLKRTDATLMFPEIVWREIGENYIYEAKKKQKAASQSLQTYLAHRSFYFDKGMLKHSPVRINQSELLKDEDWDDIQRSYLAWLKKTLNLDSRHIIGFNHNWFEKVTDRAIKHIKPFAQESDKGFKDTILWLTLLELKNKKGFSENPIVLISSNTKDFGDGVRSTELHSDLSAEAKNNGLQIEYFKSLDAFLDDWPKGVLSSHKEIVRAITPRYIRDNIFNTAKKETIEKLGFSIELKQLAITNVNYVVIHKDGVNVAEISCSGYVDLGKQYMRLEEFSANLQVALDARSNPTQIVSQTFLLNLKL